MSTLGRTVQHTMDGEPLLQSENDVVVQSGSYSVDGNDVPVNVQQDPRATLSEQRRKRWELNYHEAAIYLQEGSDNDKFHNHPGCLSALPTYLITHNTFFYLLDLLASLGLLVLTLIERPEVPGLKVHVGKKSVCSRVSFNTKTHLLFTMTGSGPNTYMLMYMIHSSLELLCLLVIGLELGMRLKWLGVRNFFTHIRTVVKFSAVVILICEAITVLIRQSNHFRVTRAIRPLFLLDSYYCRGVRRFIRQIMQSMPPILDMLILLLFFMLIFSILGFSLFSNVPGDNYFQTIEQSFISLFVLLTTANFPDVMMPAYANNRWSVLFFVTYLALELYFFMNLLLAVVYDVFSRLEKKKVKKLWLHKRCACRYAFKLLISKQNLHGITLRHFYGVMSFFKPKLKRRDIYLMFKWLNTSEDGCLSLDQFSRVYEVSGLCWKEKKQDNLWFAGLPSPLNKIFKGLNKVVTSNYFEYTVYLIIAANFIAILIETISLSVSGTYQAGSTALKGYELSWYNILFVTIYCVEALLKNLGLGPVKYFSSPWNIMDFVITLTAVIGLLLQLAHSSFSYIVILRPFRLFRLFKMRRSFRDVLGTLFILLSRMASLAVVMLVLYYFFGVIGMECFASVTPQLPNCCKNSTVENNYIRDEVNQKYGYYYLNNFSNILVSYVTLFELTVVNNWFIIMEGYAIVATQWSRIYFMIFYIATMIVMTVVVAFILEAFLFRIQYRNKMQGHDMSDDAWVRVDVGLSAEELRMCNNKNLPYTSFYIRQQRQRSIQEDEETADQDRDQLKFFQGSKLRGKTDFSMRMYADEIPEWISEEEEAYRESSDYHTESQRSTNSVRLRNNTV